MSEQKVLTNDTINELKENVEKEIIELFQRNQLLTHELEQSQQVYNKLNYKLTELETLSIKDDAKELLTEKFVNELEEMKASIEKDVETINEIRSTITEKQARLELYNDILNALE